MSSKIVVVDSRISSESENCLIKLGYTIRKISPDPRFDEPISAHPDIFMVNIAGKWLHDTAVHNAFTISEAEIKLNREAIKSDKYIYPYDVEFNCIQIGNHLICNKKYTNKIVIETALKNGIDIIDVKQGYTKCSVCKVSENAIITEDVGIAERAKQYGIDVLLIQKGYVKLDGYDYGFIGGCCGLIENNLLAFNGCIERHPDYNLINDFCNKYCVRVLSLSGHNLYDIGTIYRIV